MIENEISHYRVQRELGRGGSGAVYLAEDLRLGRQVALKLLDPDGAGSAGAWRSYREEARVIAELNHPAIATLYDIGEVDGHQFLILEYLGGDTLAARLAEGPLALNEVLRIGAAVAGGLAEAHAHGIIHRDVKPANIMFTEQGTPKLVDFGLACIRPELLPAVDPEGPTVELVPEDQIVGTLAYMAPEQLRRLGVDQRSDIYSLGVVLYEMATGRRPFATTDAVELISAVLRDRFPSVASLRPGLPERLSSLVDRCLEQEAVRRPASASEIVDELNRIARGDVGSDLPRRQSLAVLPFLDLSPEHDQGYFCDGITEELISGLAGIESLKVASRTSAFAYRDRAVAMRTIGEELGVECVLEGSVRKAGRRLRITAQLIDVADDAHLWAERFDRETDDILTIQEEIAGAIVAALKIKLTPRDSVGVHATGTRDASAYDRYLRGRSFFYRYERQGIEQALAMFEQAAELDPDYALAYTWMANCWCFMHLYTECREEGMERAEATSRRALELDVNLAEAHAARGQVLSLAGRSAEAEEHFETALRLNPRLFEAYYFYARDRFAAGELERAARLFEMANTVDPDDYQSPLLIAQIYESLGRRTDANAARRRGVKTVEARLRAWPDDVRALYFGANGLVGLGEVDRGLQWAERALALEPDEPMVLYNIGCIQSLAGQIESALDSLEKAAHEGLKQIGWFRHDSNLDPLRDHPRFIALIAWLEREAGADTPETMPAIEGGEPPIDTAE